MQDFFTKYILDAKFVLPLKIINPGVYYLLPATIILIYGIYVINGIDTWELGIQLGSFSWYVLLVILFLKPLSQIFSDVRMFAKFLVLRRQLGVAMLWLFLGHSFGTVNSLGYDIVIPLIQIDGLRSYLVWGLLAGIIIFLLGITSNTKSVKFLKKNWKRLHMLVYPALLFTAAHIYFIAGDIISLVIVVIYGVLKFLAWKKIKFSIKKYFISAQKKEA